MVYILNCFMFIRSRHYWSHSIETFSQISYYTNMAFTNEATRPSIVYLPFVWDFSNWLLSGLQQISHHSGPRF
jgi:hypothetical protein